MLMLGRIRLRPPAARVRIIFLGLANGFQMSHLCTPRVSRTGVRDNLRSFARGSASTTPLLKECQVLSHPTLSKLQFTRSSAVGKLYGVRSRK